MRRRLLIFSIVLNVVLGAIAAGLVHRHGKAERAPLPATTTRIKTTVLAAQTQTSEVHRTFVRTNRFHWSMVESEDYERYMANLRGIGCPEPTLRGIILAEVRDLFRQKRDALTPPTFWTAGRARIVAERKNDQQERALKEEMSSLTQRLLGVDFTDEPNDSDDDVLIGYAILRFIVGPAPDKSLDEVFRAMVSFGEASGRVRHKVVTLEADEAELRAARVKVKERIQKVLTPAQYEELCDRIAALAIMDDGSPTFKTFELRQVARLYRQAFGDMVELPSLFGRAKEDPESRWRFATLVRDSLGEERFTEYLSETDGSFRQLLEVAQAQQLSSFHALQVFDVRSLAEIESERLENNDLLSDSEREEQLRELQEALSAAAHEMLGDQAYGEYLASGGQWLTNGIPQ